LSLQSSIARRRRRRGRQPYPNRFVSLVTIRDCKVMHWRHYLDPLAVVQELGTAVRKVD
jgi:ketosteroid isomerase-like protein